MPDDMAEIVKLAGPMGGILLIALGGVFFITRLLIVHHRKDMETIHTVCEANHDRHAKELVNLIHTVQRKDEENVKTITSALDRFSDVISWGLRSQYEGRHTSQRGCASRSDSGAGEGDAGSGGDAE